MAMRIFHVLADEDHWSRSDIKALHRWTLPGIECPFCKDIWGVTALAYPSINTPNLKLTKKRGSLPVAYQEFQNILESVRPLVTKNQVIKPGTEFGPLEGRATGAVGDFAWVHSWYLLIRDESLRRLNELGFKSPPVIRPELSFGKRTPVSLWEFEIEATVSWDVSQLKNAFECKY